MFVGFLFIFVGFAFLSIIGWICNWFCWRNQCCCFDFLHNRTNRRIAWWVCLIFFFGVLACCISAFVTVNRFGFALEGAWCTVGRIYYDSLYGQLKINDPRWEGFDNITSNLEKLNKFCKSLNDNNLNRFIKESKLNEIKGKSDLLSTVDYIPDQIQQKIKGNEQDKNLIIESLPILIRWTKIIKSLTTIINLYKDKDEDEDEDEGRDQFSIDILNEKNFINIKTTFLDEFKYYPKTLKACLKILSMVYYNLLLITVTFAGVSLIFYACLKRQGYLKMFMVIFWNVIRFFIFSFFLYGTAYGVASKAIDDAIGYMVYVFRDNLKDNVETKLIDDGKEFFQFCLLENDNNMKRKLPEELTISLDDFFTSYKELEYLYEKPYKYISSGEINDMKSNLKESFNNLCSSSMNRTECDYLLDRASRKGGLFGSFDCGFLKSNLQHLYRTMRDASVESRILCALSVCTAFFGDISIYFFLLVLHHYDNELFFDSGNSIFTGFRGFGKAPNNKDTSQDPAYKKRKLKAEIESSSTMGVADGYKNDIKKDNNE